MFNLYQKHLPQLSDFITMAQMSSIRHLSHGDKSRNYGIPNLNILSHKFSDILF